ncbi:MAG: hypothetical protein FD124_1956, partial [Alphaproteobacteria bacterium]
MFASWTAGALAGMGRRRQTPGNLALLEYRMPARAPA